MDFEEALERFGTTDPNELPDNIKLSRKRRAAEPADETGATPDSKRPSDKAPARKR
jgi:hypothetical protein